MFDKEKLEKLQAIIEECKNKTDPKDPVTIYHGKGGQNTFYSRNSAFGSDGKKEEDWNYEIGGQQ